jgi:hypothetical protein
MTNKQVAASWLFLSLLCASPALAQRYSDEEVRQMIIRDSLAGFGSRDCPCPYSYAWNGQQCADNSLYNKRTGRRDIFCYPADVSYRDIEDYRRREYRR